MILVISKLLVITDGRRFCNIKETDNNKYIIHVGSRFSLGSTAGSAEIVCNQPNFNRTIFVISQILADFFSLRDNSANPNISRFFQPSVFQIEDWEFSSKLVGCVARYMVERRSLTGKLSPSCARPTADW